MEASAQTNRQPAASQRVMSALKEARTQLEALKSAHTEPIAIIGMACRFPGANNTTELWQLLMDERIAISDVPTERWAVDDYYEYPLESDDAMNTRRGGFLDHIDQFDPSFFGISYREACTMDPQQRLVLEVGWEALENAGIAPTTLAGSQTGIYVGGATTDYADILLDAPARGGSGVDSAFIANRLSFWLDLRGPSMVVDTACSSGLLAMHLACQSLRLQEIDMALVGGVNVILSPRWTVSYSQAGMLATDGRCKTFDAAADGNGRAEGCGMVVLKRLSAAQHDGDRILAVIRGSAVKQDGRTMGLTTPSGLAQQAVIRQALKNAGVTADEIDYIETHGTGTPLGDSIEVAALAAIFGGVDSRPRAIGSVKANIGHAEAAAGISGVIKTVLCLQHGVIPPQPQLTELNPNLQLGSLVIPRRAAPCPIRPRLAGVTSFGIGGTNVHVILGVAPDATAHPGTDQTTEGATDPKRLERPRHLLTLSAKTEPALRQLAARYRDCLTTEPTISRPQRALASTGSAAEGDELLSVEQCAVTPADCCFTANTGRAHFPQRLAIHTDSIAAFRAQLSAFVDGEPEALTQTGVASEPPKVAFLFTGQGSQYVGMGRELYETQPIFRQTFDLCNKILQPLLRESLLPLLYPTTAENRGDQYLAQIKLNQTTYAQPALFAVEYALAELWQSWGIVPDALWGHSGGEYVAACVAGVFSLEDGLRLIAERGRLMRALPAIGQMEAIFAEPVLVPFTAIADEITYHAPRIPLISNVTGQFHREPPTAAYWASHMRQSIQLATGMETLYGAGIRTFLEMGPTDTLIEMGQRALPKETGTWLPSLDKTQSAWETMLHALAALYVAGVDVNWSRFDEGYVRWRIALPSYPFQRKRCWLEEYEVKSYQNRKL